MGLVVIVVKVIRVVKGLTITRVIGIRLRCFTLSVKVFRREEGT